MGEPRLPGGILAPRQEVLRANDVYDSRGSGQAAAETAMQQAPHEFDLCTDQSGALSKWRAARSGGSRGGSGGPKRHYFAGYLGTCCHGTVVAATMLPTHEGPRYAIVAMLRTLASRPHGGTLCFFFDTACCLFATICAAVRSDDFFVEKLFRVLWPESSGRELVCTIVEGPDVPLPHFTFTLFTSALRAAARATRPLRMARARPPS